jgi:hypothetical protein
MPRENGWKLWNSCYFFYTTLAGFAMTDSRSDISARLEIQLEKCWSLAFFSSIPKIEAIS